MVFFEEVGGSLSAGGGGGRSKPEAGGGEERGPAWKESERVRALAYDSFTFPDHVTRADFLVLVIPLFFQRHVYQLAVSMSAVSVMLFPAQRSSTGFNILV